MTDDGSLDGDLVGGRRKAGARDGQVVVVRLDGELTIKRLLRLGNALRLLPRNSTYKSIDSNNRGLSRMALS